MDASRLREPVIESLEEGRLVNSQKSGDLQLVVPWKKIFGHPELYHGLLALVHERRVATEGAFRIQIRVTGFREYYLLYEKKTLHLRFPSTAPSIRVLHFFSGITRVNILGPDSLWVIESVAESHVLQVGFDALSALSLFLAAREKRARAEEETLIIHWNGGKLPPDSLPKLRVPLYRHPILLRNFPLPPLFILFPELQIE